MKKCKRCGAEFESNFCPNCGAKYEETSICGRCGNSVKAGAKFCENCGSPVSPAAPVGAIGDSAPARAKKAASSPMLILHKALGYVPSVLALLFSILLFAFYAAPVAMIGGGELFGNESMGNVYSMQSGILGEIPQLKAGMTALITAAAVVLAYSAVVLTIGLLKKTRYKEIAVGKNKIRLFKLLGLCFVAVYLVFLILGAVVMAEIARFDEGAGLALSGACPKLIISFSVIFAAFSVGSAIADKLLLKNKPEIVVAEEKQMADRERAESERKANFYATHSAPQEPPAGSGVLSITRYKHQKRRYDKAKEGAPSEVLVRLDAYKARLIVIAVILSIAVMVISIPISLSMNIFRVGKVEKIELGDSYNTVEEILGEPHIKDDLHWKYFGKNYLEQLKKIEKNHQQQEQALKNKNEKEFLSLVEKETILIERINKMSYKYIEISFSDFDQYNEKKVVNVVLDLNRKNNKLHDGKKSIKQIALSETQLLCNTHGLLPDIEVEYKYGDGSYQLGLLQNDATSIIDVKEPGEYNLEWSDEIGDYKTTVDVVKTLRKEGRGYIGEGNFLLRFFGLDQTADAVLEITEEKGEFRVIIQGKAATNIMSRKERKIGSATYSSFKYFIDRKYWDKITSVEITQGVKSIAREVFRGWNLTEIAIPDSVTSIDTSELRYIYLTVEDGNKKYSSQDGALYDKNKTKLFYVPCGKTGTFNVPEGVRSIEYGAFKDCWGITCVVLPNSLNSIGGNAFSGCGSLASINIPNGVKSIGEGAFENCKALTSITIPNSVKKIKMDVFFECNYVTIFCEAKKKPIGWSKYWNQSYYNHIIWDCANNDEDEDGYAYATIDGLKYRFKDGSAELVEQLRNIAGDVVIPEYITYKDTTYRISIIAENAFEGCRSLASVTMPESIVRIEAWAFSGCCDSFTLIFNGTKAQFMEIDTGYNWCGYNINIHCTDGDIAK